MLTHLLFGGCAVTWAAWHAWCLGWLTLNQTACVSVVSWMVLGVAYGWKAVRHYRTLHPEALPTRFKSVAWFVWFCFGFWVIKQLGQASEIPQAASLLAILYFFYAYLSLLMVRTHPKLISWVAVDTLLGFLGWGTLLRLLVRFRVRYLTAVQPVQLTRPDELDWMLSHLTPTAVVLLAVALILAAWLLRLELYHRRSGVPRREFFKPLPGLVALAAFVVALAFGAIVRMKIGDDLSAEIRAAEAIFQMDLKAPLPTGEALPDDFVKADNEYLQSLQLAGERVTVAVKEGQPKRHYQWAHAAGVRWRLPKQDAPARLKELQEAFAAPMRQVEAVAALLPPSPPCNGKTSRRIYNLVDFAYWRQCLALYSGDHAEAVAQFRLATRLALDLRLEAAADRPGARALNLTHWLDAAEVLLDDPATTPEEVASLEEDCARWEQRMKANDLPSIIFEIKDNFHYLERVRTDADLRPAPTPRQLRWVLPEFGALLQAEQLQLLRHFMRVQRWDDLGPATSAVSILTQVTIAASRLGAERRQVALSRLAAMRILLAARRFQFEQKHLPQSLDELVPRFLKALPEDPLAKHAPFLMERKTRPIARMDILTGEPVETTEETVVIRSSTARAEAYFVPENPTAPTP